MPLERALERAHQTLRHIKWFEVTGQLGDRAIEFQIELEVGFALEDHAGVSGVLASVSGDTARILPRDGCPNGACPGGSQQGTARRPAEKRTQRLDARTIWSVGRDVDLTSRPAVRALARPCRRLLLSRAAWPCPPGWRDSCRMRDRQEAPG
jgi:hypothetical protein